MTGILNRLRVDIPTLVSQMPSVHVKSSEASLVAASVVGTLTVVQLLTDWDPLGRCFTFWRQLRHHVSAKPDHGNIFFMMFSLPPPLCSCCYIIVMLFLTHNHIYFSLYFLILHNLYVKKGKETFMLGIRP
jgi:hypothetical protein